MKTALIATIASTCVMMTVTANSATAAKDTQAPAITAFSVPALVKSFTVPVTSLTASDNAGVTGYLITKSATPPAAKAAGWSAARPTTFTSTAPGPQTLYAWAKDAAGNVSAAKAANITIDTALPTITTFTVPVITNSLTIPISAFTASDNIAVTGYMITLSATAPAPEAAGWSAARPATFTASATGVVTLYAWAKDSAGNVSAAKTASVTIDTTLPTITSFAVPDVLKTTTIPISVFSASDNVAVAGYMITLSPLRPLASATGWLSRPPTIFNTAASGTINLYAWVKDTAGNVSIPVTDTVKIDTIAPVISSFSVPAQSGSLTVPVTSLTANDNMGVTGYLITESAATPLLTANGWSISVPASYTAAASGAKTLYAWARDAAGNVSAGRSAACTVNVSSTAAFTLAQTLADQPQGTTLAFSALAMMTGNLGAQSFFPPGKVADYTGFQYLRDNAPDGIGHNTSFLTRIAENVIYILNDTQLQKLATLATAQQAAIDEYGIKRYPLMNAFRQLMDPSNNIILNLGSVKAASRALYLIDGQISYDRAVLYADILNSLDNTQKFYLEEMKGKVFNTWNDTSTEPYKSAVDLKKKSVGQASMVAIMTYAGDLFSWYAGSIDADVYFCPERHGTYFGSFFMKDAPAVGHEGYQISTSITGEAGRALSDSAYGIVDANQAATMSGLVETQRNNLYKGTTNIVSIRTQIASLLRTLLTKADTDRSVYNKVIALSGSYGDLDGENNYNYATVISNMYKTLADDQKARLMELRQKIMKGTYSTGVSFDFTYTDDYYLYSAVIPDATAATYIGDTTVLFQ